MPLVIGFSSHLESISPLSTRGSYRRKKLSKNIKSREDQKEEEVEELTSSPISKTREPLESNNLELIEEANAEKILSIQQEEGEFFLEKCPFQEDNIGERTSSEISFPMIPRGENLSFDWRKQKKQELKPLDSQENLELEKRSAILVLQESQESGIFLVTLSLQSKPDNQIEINSNSGLGRSSPLEENSLEDYQPEDIRMIEEPITMPQEAKILKAGLPLSFSLLPFEESEFQEEVELSLPKPSAVPSQNDLGLIPHDISFLRTVSDPKESEIKEDEHMQDSLYLLSPSFNEDSYYLLFHSSELGSEKERLIDNQSVSDFEDLLSDEYLYEVQFESIHIILNDIQAKIKRSQEVLQDFSLYYSPYHDSSEADFQNKTLESLTNLSNSLERNLDALLIQLGNASETDIEEITLRRGQIESLKDMLEITHFRVGLLKSQFEKLLSSYIPASSFVLSEVSAETTLVTPSAHSVPPKTINRYPFPIIYGYQIPKFKERITLLSSIPETEDLEKGESNQNLNINLHLESKDLKLEEEKEAPGFRPTKLAGTVDYLKLILSKPKFSPEANPQDLQHIKQNLTSLKNQLNGIKQGSGNLDEKDDPSLSAVENLEVQLKKLRAKLDEINLEESTYDSNTLNMKLRMVNHHAKCIEEELEDFIQ